MWASSSKNKKIEVYGNPTALAKNNVLVLFEVGIGHEVILSRKNDLCERLKKYLQSINYLCCCKLSFWPHDRAILSLYRKFYDKELSYFSNVCTKISTGNCFVSLRVSCSLNELRKVCQVDIVEFSLCVYLLFGKCWQKRRSSSSPISNCREQGSCVMS